MEALVRDVRYSLRALAGDRRFAAVSILTLALGIGANTAVFGVLNAVVLRPLPYVEPDRLVRIYQTVRGEDEYLPGPTVVALREHSQTLDIAAVYTYRAEGADLTGGARPERVRTLPVSADYFRVLGVDPILGRPLERADEGPGTRVAIVSERIWREYLGGAADAPGRTLMLNALPHRVVGILPASFDDPIQPGVEVWTPIDLRTPDSNSWQNNYLSAIGRLRPAATIGSAQAELETICARLQPNYGADAARRSARIVTLHGDVVGNAGHMLWVLLGAVGLLLLIACVNVASLMLARAASREKDLAVRAALGSSRWRLVRQLLIEAILIAAAGAIAGLALAAALDRLLMAAAPEVVVRTGAGRIEAAVFLFSAAAALASAVAFGLVPALQFARPDLEALLRESSRSASAGRRRTRARQALVACQVTLAFVLLVGAALLLESFVRLRAVKLGLEAAHVMTFEVHLPGGRYDAAARSRFHRDLQARLERIPPVRAAGAISRLPVTGTFHSWGTRRTDRPEVMLQTEQRVIEGRYFEALRIPLVRGRTFGPEDDEAAPRRVVVSRELERQLFAGEDAIGKQIRAGGQTAEIIGIVGDVALAPRARPRPTIYHAHRQFADNRNWSLTQVVATSGAAGGLLGDIRRELAALDADLVLYQPRPLAGVIGEGISQERFAMLLLGAFAALALVLAAIGIYGVLSYAVASRRREIAIRLALGAPPYSVRRGVVRDGGALATAGIAAGLVLAYLATRSLGWLLYDVSAADPIVYSAAGVVLLAVAIAAAWLPARAATREGLGVLLAE